MSVLVCSIRMGFIGCYVFLWKIKIRPINQSVREVWVIKLPVGN